MPSQLATPPELGGHPAVQRAAACEMTVRAGAALVAAHAGSAMLRSSPAKRWAREALFHQVQAQTVAVRAAQLRRYAEVGR